MKKLISILLMLMVLFSGIALAEEAETAPTEAPIVETVEDSAQVTEQDEETEIDWSSVSLSTKGLIVTAGGLAGTFLVLILFFLTIKLMQKVLVSPDTAGSSKTRS